MGNLTVPETEFYLQCLANFIIFNQTREDFDPIAIIFDIPKLFVHFG